eukprot:SAG31_NODE_1281_length_9019_cov_4.758072_5_plen_281_part_00
MEHLRDTYREVIGKDPPVRYKNDRVWLRTKIQAARQQPLLSRAPSVEECDPPAKKQKNSTFRSQKKYDDLREELNMFKDSGSALVQLKLWQKNAEALPDLGRVLGKKRMLHTMAKDRFQKHTENVKVIKDEYSKLRKDRIGRELHRVVTNPEYSRDPEALSKYLKNVLTWVQAECKLKGAFQEARQCEEGVKEAEADVEDAQSKSKEAEDYITQYLEKKKGYEVPPEYDGMTATQEWSDDEEFDTGAKLRRTLTDRTLSRTSTMEAADTLNAFTGDEDHS